MTEPVYAFRRRGQDDFCTCTFKRYTELSDFPEKFEMRIFYTAPQPSPTAQAVAEPADTVVLNAAMRAIQQAIGLIGAPTDERMRAVRRVLRGAVVVAEDSGDTPALPAPPAMDASPSAASIAWNALRDATDPLGELGARIMGHVRIYAQRQYEAGRTSHWQAPAHVLHLVQDAFAEVAMAYPKACALHKVGLADTAVRKALATPSPQAAQQAPAGAWMECWYGSGGKEGYEGWSIVSKEGRSLVAYLGRGVEPDAVTEIVMAHNAAPAAPSTPTSGGWISVERHSDQSVLVVFPSCRLASEFERSLLPASPTIGGESNG